MHGSGPSLPSTGFIGRLKSHKVIEWTLAYAALAYTLLHGVEMVAEALEWPHVIARVLTLVLILGVPVIATLAWYQGAQGLKRISGPELAILTVLLFIAGSVLWGFSRSSQEHETAKAPAMANSAATAPAAEPAPSAPPAPRTAVAVLPFANLTGDASKEYLGDGMAEELINTLAKVQGLKVPARTSTFAYKGRNTDIRQIAKDLGVGTILEGSVRAAGKRIRITAQLINAQDGLHLWSETYDEDSTDLFQLQDKLATQIASALRPSLDGTPAAEITQTPPTPDVQAYQLYLQGWSLADRLNAQNENRAIEYFQQALMRDPKFARAYAGIAEAHMNLGAGLGRAPFANYAAAEQAAQTALTLDPTVAAPHNALAGINAFRGQLVEMEAHDRAARSLSPNDGLIRVLRAEHEGVLGGHLRQMVADGQEAYSLAPAHPYVVALVASFYSLIGQDAEALKYAGFALDLGHPQDSDPLPTIRARAARRAGRYAQAAAMLPNSFDKSDPEQARAAEVVRLVYAALANPADRASAVAARTRLYPKGGVADWGGVTKNDASPCIASSLAYALLGALDVAYDLGNQCLSNLAPAAVRIGDQTADLWSPEMRPFRQDPRFQAFAARLGFIEYWQQYGPPDDCDLKNGKLTCH